jgi:dTDP-4-dehydrorhamnose reductase
VSRPRPIAVTGATGRLGSALVERLLAEERPVVAWSRPDYDLDDPRAANRCLMRDRPDYVIHTAAWTDVDGCARDPDLAMRRNAQAVRWLAEDCRAMDAGLVLVSTNEVFDGARNDGQGYREDDPTAPLNAYGRSKLAGEVLMRQAMSELSGGWIVRTAWLFGPPTPDFPARILAAAERLAAGESLRVVADEVGSPTYAPDLAAAILDLLASAPAGDYHLVNAGMTSRHGWAEAVLRGCGRSTPLVPIPASDYERTSTPPRWAVLDASRAARQGIVMRDWRAALRGYLPWVCGG